LKCDVFEKHGWGAFFAASAPLVAKVALCLRARLVKAASATVSGAYKSAEEAYEEAAREVERMVRRMAGDCAGEYARALARARVLAEGGGGRDGIAYRDVMAREVSRLAQRGLVATSYVRRDGTVVNVPVDVGLRRALHAAGRQRRMGYALEVAGETSGLVEVSWTRNARKSHADWQGGVYRVRKAREGEDIDRYPDFRKACRVGDPVDGIGGYNCGHKVTAYRPDGSASSAIRARRRAFPRRRPARRRRGSAASRTRYARTSASARCWTRWGWTPAT